MYDYNRSFSKSASKEGIEQIRQDIVKIDILIAESDDAEMMAVPLNELSKAPRKSSDIIDRIKWETQQSFDIYTLIDHMKRNGRLPDWFFDKPGVSKSVKDEYAYVATAYVSTSILIDQYVFVVNFVAKCLEHLGMETKLIAKLSAAKRNFEKRCLKGISTKDLKNVIDTYTTMISCLRVISETVKFALKNQKSAEGNTGISIGNMQLINAGNFDNDTVEKAAKLIKDVATIMSSRGFSRLLYGPVSLVQKLSATADAFAFYNNSTDSIYLQSIAITSGKLKPHPLIHEFGHRLLNKGSYDEHVESMFGVLRTISKDQYTPEFLKELESKYITLGKTFKWKASNFTITQTKPLYKNSTWYVAADKVTRQKTTPILFALKDFMDVVYDKDISEQNLASCFVTNYASTNAQENFCEMFAYYCLGMLNDPNKKLFEEYMKAIF